MTRPTSPLDCAPDARANDARSVRHVPAVGEYGPAGAAFGAAPGAAPGAARGVAGAVPPRFGVGAPDPLAAAGALAAFEAAPERAPHSAADEAAALDPVYRRGDRIMAALVGGHALLALALAPVHDSWGATLLVTALACAGFYLSWWRAPGRFVTRAMAGVALQAFCALHIYQLDGLAEMHFFYFTSVTAMILYQDWRALWPGIAAIIAQHTLFSTLHNAEIYPGGHRFFEPTHVSPAKLAWHYGIALGQSALASYAALVLRRRTLREVAHRGAIAAQAARLGEANQTLAATNHRLEEQATELEAQQRQLEEQATELEAQAAHLEEQAEVLAAGNVRLQRANGALTETNAALAAARAAADAAQARYGALLASIDDVFVAVDGEWRVTYANAAAAALLGEPPGALVGRSLWALFPDASAGAIRQAAADAVRTRALATAEGHYAPADLWFEVRAYPTPDGVSVFLADVGTRRRLEQALRESEMRFRAVQEHSPDGFMLFRAVRDAADPARPIVDFEWLFANEAAARLVGRPSAELVGRRLLVEMPGNRDEGLFDGYVRVVEDGAPFGREFHYAHDGIDRWFANLAVPVGDGFGVTFTDITARKRAEQERDASLQAERAARAEADAANRAKAQFLAAMSHELRTPLNAITGYADLLTMELRGPITAAQAEDVGRIKRSGQHLLVLINDILHFAKLEAGQVRFHIEPLAVETLFDEVEPLVAPQMAARRLAFTLAADAGDAVVLADRDKVRQILVNLLTNAAKFTPPDGRVRLAARALDAHVEIDVADTGVGIRAEQHEAIFEPFMQVDRDMARDSRLGVGLGLAISRDLARGMRGELRVASEPGVGSTFTLRLPRAGERNGAGGDHA